MDSYMFNDAMGFLLMFRKHLEEHSIEYTASRDQKELMFRWRGSDMRLTVMDNGFIVAGEKYKLDGGGSGYDITSDRAIWLGDHICEYRKRKKN
jgi:hypothetical protein